MPLHDESLQNIICNLRDGTDREGNFHLLFVRFYSEVCRYFRGKGVSAEDSDDLAQEVFCLVFTRLHSLRDEAHFPGWLFTISRNVFNNEIDRRHARKRMAAAATHRADDGDIPDIAERQQDERGTCQCDELQR